MGLQTGDHRSMPERDHRACAVPRLVPLPGATRTGYVWASRAATRHAAANVRQLPLRSMWSASRVSGRGKSNVPTSGLCPGRPPAIGPASRRRRSPFFAHPLVSNGVWNKHKSSPFHSYGKLGTAVSLPSLAQGAVSDESSPRLCHPRLPMQPHRTGSPPWTQRSGEATTTVHLGSLPRLGASQ